MRRGQISKPPPNSSLEQVPIGIVLIACRGVHVLFVSTTTAYSPLHFETKFNSNVKELSTCYVQDGCSDVGSLHL